MKSLLIITFALLSLPVTAQKPDKKSVVIGSLTDKPNALLVVNPQDSDQGVLLPQLSPGQRMSLKPSSPAEDGLIVFDTHYQNYFYWSNGTWVRMDASNVKKSSFYSIDPASFRELKPNNEISYNNLAVFEADNTFVTATRDGMGEEIIAPVSLPHGAVIKEVTVYYMDSDTDNLHVSFMRKSHGGNNETIIAWESSGAATSVAMQSFDYLNGMETVDLDHFTYRIIIRFDIDAEDIIVQPADAKQRIYGIKIKYQQ